MKVCGSSTTGANTTGATTGMGCGTCMGGYSVRTTQKTAKWDTTSTMRVASATERMSLNSMGFVWTLSFIIIKQTAMEVKENPMMDARVDALYRVIKGRINFENIIPTCIEVAGEIEHLTHLRGPQKLELLQKVLRVALKDSDLPSEKKEDVLMFVDSILPVVMQAAILASKSPIGIHVQRACVSCWTKK